MASTMRNQSGNRSLRIAEDLRRAITDGALPASARLPAQRELAHQYATTLMTIREALALLETEGLIRSEHGVGTFVTDSGLDPDALQLASFNETTASASLQTVLRQVDPNTHAPEAARLLALPPATPLVMLERLRLLAGAPIVYQQSFLPPALAGLVATFHPDMSLYLQLQAQFGARAVASRETLQPVALSPAQAILLAQAVGAPAFRSCRLTLDLHGRPLVYDEALLAGDRWVLVGDRLGRRGEWEVRLGSDVHAALEAWAGGASENRGSFAPKGPDTVGA
jgi:GntR family transcriptional regulator